MLKDHRDDWPTGMGVTEPPICARCRELSARLCPAPRRGWVEIRSKEHPIAGVRGLLYRPDLSAGGATLDFDDPRIGWIRAFQPVRRFGAGVIG